MPGDRLALAGRHLADFRPDPAVELGQPRVVGGGTVAIERGASRIGGGQPLGDGVDVAACGGDILPAVRVGALPMAVTMTV